MDRHVKFSLATKKQAAGLFRQMLLPTAGELAKRRALEPADKEGEGGGEKWEAREEAQRRDVLRLADAFAEHVPDDTLCVCPPCSRRTQTDADTPLRCRQLDRLAPGLPAPAQGPAPGGRRRHRRCVLHPLRALVP